MPFVDASLHCFYAFCSYYLFLSVYQISNNRTERTEADEGIKGFFIFSRPRGFRQKNLQNRDPVQLEGRPKGSRAFRRAKAKVSI
jgi:hypothetical protein